MGPHRARRSEEEDEDDSATPGFRARVARWEREQAITAVLGLVYRNTTGLPLAHGGPVLELKDREGRTLRWGLWAPHRRVLLDVFPRAMPPAEEIADRAAFARAHGLRYGVVEPGRVLTPESLKEWVDGQPD